MEALQLFLIEAAISLVVSGVVIFSLTKPLRRLLVDSCGTEARAKFWVVYCNIMLVIAPLLAVILYGKSNLGQADFAFYKTAIGCALVGIFVSLAVIGAQINKSLPKSEQKSSSAS